jgi:hypothetical protein
VRRRTSATEAAIASTLTASFAGSLSLDQAVELGAPPPQLTDARRLAFSSGCRGRMAVAAVAVAMAAAHHEEHRKRTGEE